MAQVDYSEEELFQIGRTCYDKLVLHCQNLEISGFWDQAQKVMQQSSSEVLDLYVQAVLMKLAVQCGEILESQLRFIQTVSCSNPLSISEDMVIDEKFLRDVDRIYNMPPILIQLCSLYDKEKQDDTTEYFVDALLNILLCMAYLNNGKNAEIDEFVHTYYNKVSIYIAGRDSMMHTRYLMHKVNNSNITCDVDEMKEEERLRQSTIPPGGETSFDPMSVEWIDADDLVYQKEYENETTEDLSYDNYDADEEVEYISEAGFGDGGVAYAEAESTDKVGHMVYQPGDFAIMEQPQLEKLQILLRIKHKNARQEQEKARAERERQRKENRKLREAEQKEKEEQAKETFLEVKQRIQEREQAEAKEQEMRIQKIVDELDELVGLSSVKNEISSLINLIKIRKLREKMNLPGMDMSYHMVFTGSPGTGKTTVARLVAKIYKELGILSEGNLVETDRSGLVAGYVGQTAIKVHEIVEQAIGGILFIDEAYSLTNPDVPNDFGTEAIDTLVKLMEDHRDNLVVIVAGYTDEMQNFLKSNTGLISRFNKFIDFPDYSKEELVEILDVMAENAGLTIDDDAKQAVYEMLCMKPDYEWEEFGNARGMRNLFEKFVMNQANRLVFMESPSKEDLTVIKKEDIVI